MSAADELLAEARLSAKFLTDKRGPLPDVLRGYGPPFTPARRASIPGCSACGEEDESRLIWTPSLEAVCRACIPRRFGRSQPCAALGCARPCVSAWFVCAVHLARWRSWRGPAIFTKREQPLAAKLYILHGAPLALSSQEARLVDPLNERLGLPGALPITRQGGFASLNLSWLARIRLNVPASLTHPFSYTVLHDYRPIWDMNSGAWTPVQSAKDLLAAYMQANLTPGERAFENLLKSAGLHAEFQPQVRISGYIVDFLHSGLRNDGQLCKPFVVEIDGKHHASRTARERDARRTAHLQRLGYRVVRFTNDDVFTRPASVLKAISILRAPDDSL